MFNVCSESCWNSRGSNVFCMSVMYLCALTYHTTFCIPSSVAVRRANLNVQILVGYATCM